MPPDYTKKVRPAYEFHAHTLQSDGCLSGLELLRRAYASGYKAVALTDHASIPHIGRLMAETIADCEFARNSWNIEAIAGVEITHVPVNALDSAVRLARDYGAELIMVHGETFIEPVECGCNHAAVTTKDVDILSHPGFITEEDAALAAKNDVFLELTGRCGHSLCNGYLVQVARKTGAKLIVSNDIHGPDDLKGAEWSYRIARGAGLTKEEAKTVVSKHPMEIVERAQARRRR